jgi:DNA (cytosine-5)-methyltransferase 1
MKVLDLFSGIGGFALGLEEAGMETAAFCEIDKSCHKVLKKHWPDIPIFEDVATLNKDTLDNHGIDIDVIVGGFPCQDISYAGYGQGLAGARSGLWFDFLRLTEEIQPKYIIAENVSALRTRGLDEVLRSLYAIGYDAEWHCIPASYVGAWHKRDRIWIVAYPNSIDPQGSTKEPVLRQSHLSLQPARSFAKWTGRSDLPESRFCRSLDGLSGGSHRLKQLGNAVIPQIPEIIGKAIMEKHNDQRT